jgi:hypothetical protein
MYIYVHVAHRTNAAPKQRHNTTQTTMELQTLPIGEQSFVKLRTKNRLYVDKTEFIYRMIQDGTYYFLSRPRRFGKSLLLNTIEAFFQGQRELFNDLYIANKEQDWAVHPVFHFDFSVQSYNSEQSLYAILNHYVVQFEKEYSISSADTDISLRFATLIRQAYEQTGHGVVILVDEYDKPLLEVTNDPELQDAYRKMLRSFYAVLKSANQYIRFVFLTGITKFSKISIFSDLNNLNDISRDSDYATVCGLTDEEIDRDMVPYIQAFAEKKAKSYDEIRNKLRRMYDGYHFVDKTPALYNPFSVMCALGRREFGSYWFETGTPTILVEMLQRHDYPLASLEDEPVDSMMLDSKDGIMDSIVPLLYQTGYMCIRKTTDDGQLSWMTFPNEEVRHGFFRFLLPYYASVERIRTNVAISAFVADVRSGNAEQFLQRLQSFFADFQYDAQTTPESHFRNVLYILCKLMGLQVDAEYQTSDGRIDLLLRTDKFVYIIECKIDSTARIALDQIKSKEYALPWSLDNRETILIGLNFSTTTRRPDNWLIEHPDGSLIEGVKNAREQEREQEGEQVKEQVKKLVLALGKDTKKREELMQLLQLAGRRNFKQNYIDPSIDEGYMAMLYPEAPNRKDQAYYLTDKGLALLAELTKE